MCSISTEFASGSDYPSYTFHDDVKLTAPHHQKAAWRGLNRLIALLGWLFDVDKDSITSFVGPFRSLIEHFSAVAYGGQIGLPTKPGFVMALSKVLTEAIAARRLESGELRSLIGKLLFQSIAYVGRVGRGQLSFLNAQAATGEAQPSEEALQCLRFHLAICAIQLQPAAHH